MAASEVTKTAEELSGASSHEIDVKLISDSSIHYVTATGTVTNVNGPVAGALVTVSGNSELTATTDAGWEICLKIFPAVDCTVLVEKDGYIFRRTPPSRRETSKVRKRILISALWI